jgi:chromosome partitioning protein
VAQLPRERKEVAPVAIPAATEVEQMGVHRQAVVDSAPTSRAAVAYRELWAAVRARAGIAVAPAG